MDRYAQVAMLQLAIMNHRLFMLDDEVQARQRGGSNDCGSGHGYLFIYLFIYIILRG